MVTCLSKSFALILLTVLLSTLAGCNSNEVTQNVEVTIDQSDVGPQEPTVDDTVNPLLIVGGGMAIVFIGFLAMVGFSFYYRVPIRVVVTSVLVLAILAIAIGMHLQQVPT